MLGEPLSGEPVAAFSGSGVPLLSHSNLVISCLDYCNVLYMKSIWKAFGSYNWCRVQYHGQCLVPESGPCYTAVLQAAWLLICFWVQLKVLIITLKITWHGSRLLHEPFHPNGTGLSHLFQQRTHAMYLVSQGIPAGSVQKSLLCMAPNLWSIWPPGVRSAPPLQIFCKNLKTWLCQLT